MLPPTIPPSHQSPLAAPFDPKSSKIPGILDRIQCIQLEGRALDRGEIVLESLSQFKNLRTLRLAYYPRHPQTSSVFQQSSHMLNPLMDHAEDPDVSSFVSEPEFEFHPEHPSSRPEIRISRWLRVRLCPCCFKAELYSTASSEEKKLYGNLNTDRLYRYWPLLERFELEGIHILDTSIGPLLRCLRAREIPCDEEEDGDGESQRASEASDSSPLRPVTPTKEVPTVQTNETARQFSLSMKNCSLSRFFAPTKRIRIPEFVATSAYGAERVLNETLASLV